MDNKTGREIESNCTHTLNELRGKLERRNSLLNVIRKAYHRDVLVIKECLIEAQRKDSNLLSKPLETVLSSVPSTDLRETFRLFAPQECEMRVRPCFTCGGTLEVIHRESTRIVEYKHSIQVLWEREKDLCQELILEKLKAKEDRETLQVAIERSNNEREVLLEHISSLNQEVADRNKLDTDVRHLKEEVISLNRKLRENELSLLERDRLLLDFERLRSITEQDSAKINEHEETIKLLQDKTDSRNLQLLVLEQENGQLKNSLLEISERYAKADDACNCLRQKLSCSEDEANNLRERFNRAQVTISELQTQFTQDEQQMKVCISDLEFKCTSLGAIISDLDQKFNESSANTELYHQSIIATLKDAQKRGLITCIPQQRDAMLAQIYDFIGEADMLRQEKASLINLLHSCIRMIYENCLSQEQLLHENGLELHKNDHRLTVFGQTNCRALEVINHLDNSEDSRDLAWSSILADTTDRRHIMGNLQNRMHMGNFSLKKAFQKIRDIHDIELRDIKRNLDEEINRRYNIEKQLIIEISVKQKYQKKLNDLLEMNVAVKLAVHSLRASLLETRRECIRNFETWKMLQDDHQRVQTLALNLVGKLDAMKNVIIDQKANLTEKEAEISMRDSAIVKMESLLEKITHKYAKNERLRIKVHSNTAIQAKPEVANASVHADFLPAVMCGSYPPVPENKSNQAALVPGRIINLSCEENWPSRINVEPKSYLQYRRALDKL